jgi:endonuclease-3
MTDQNRASEIACILKKKYPDAECTLNFKYPWQLMIAAILAAQCTDARVNIITADLFETSPDLIWMLCFAFQVSAGKSLI